MYNIGYIDDKRETFDDLNEIFESAPFKLVFVENVTAIEGVIQWITDNNIKCMLVDYKLSNYYDFLGTTLVMAINKSLPDLPCIILSSHCEDGINDKLVIKSLFWERDKIIQSQGSDEYNSIVKQLNEATEVFENRVKIRLNEYENLLKKRNLGTITAREEDEFSNLYKCLLAYGELDDIPASLLTNSTVEKIDSLLSLLDKLLKKEEE